MTQIMLALDVFSDVVCPFCFIGKRRLDEAVAAERAEGREVVVRWHAFQLNPEVPEEGLDERAFFERKFGGEAAMRQAWDHVARLGAPAGIAFDFERPGRRAPNTRLAHRAVALAGREAPERQDAAVEALFAAFFERGEDVGDRDVVLRLTGVDPGALDAGGGADEVEADLAAAASLGIGGVPFFIADRSVALSGAADADAYRQLMAEARRRATTAA
jgi:predicted DsbA family dithiol-disulfide isomerase